MKICPKCNFRFIANDADMCHKCAEKMCYKSAHSEENSYAIDAPKKNRQRHNFGEKFVFKNEPASYGGFHGFRAYNNDGENVGIVFMTSDKKTPAYGNCELSFYSKYHNRYGQYHRIKSSGGYIPWRLLCERLNKYGFVEYYID